jgi:hypothetical protein
MALRAWSDEKLMDFKKALMTASAKLEKSFGFLYSNLEQVRLDPGISPLFYRYLERESP